MFSRLAILAGVLSFSAVAIFLAFGLPPGHSSIFNYAWTTQYSQALSWSNPFPRYLPGLAAGFGAHDFFFYAPLPFWFIAAIVDPLCPGCSRSTEFILGSAIFLVASGFAMFAFLRSFFTPQAAVFGAVVYAVLPYHLLVDWVDRQAVGEFAAYAFIPLVALGLERICGGRRSGAILAIGVAGTALCHLPTAILAAHVFGAVLIVLLVFAKGGVTARIRLFARCAGFATLGLALAAFYWVPAVLLLETVSSDVLFDPYFEAWRWLYGREAPQPNGHFVLIIAASFLACAPFLLGSILSHPGRPLVWLIVPVAVALLLNSALSEGIWRHWIIARVQFPWRLMTFVDFATGIAAAVLFARATTRVGWWVLAAAFLAAVVPTAFVVQRTAVVANFGTSEVPSTEGLAAIEYLSPAMRQAIQTRLGGAEIDHFDQRDVSRTIAAMAVEFNEANPHVTILERGPRAIVVLAPPGAKVFSIPVQYWFLWSAETSAGVPLELRPNSVFGTIDIIAPESGFDPGPTRLWLRYHPSELAGGVLSLLAMAFLLGSALRSRRMGV